MSKLIEYIGWGFLGGVLLVLVYGDYQYYVNESFCLSKGASHYKQGYCVFVAQGQNINVPVETVRNAR